MDASRLDYFELADLQMLENIERRLPWIRERNSDLDDLDEIDFHERYRFNKSTTGKIIDLVSPLMEDTTHRNNALTKTEKVLAALRFFACGTFQVEIGDLQGMCQPSSCRSINEVAKCLAQLRPNYIYLPQTEDERMEISQKFYSKYGFPSVYGALDCTLIKINSPGGSYPETYRSRKGHFALNVQTLSDADLLIRNIVVRWPGSTHDSSIFNNSYLRAHLETQVPANYHVVGDAGYPLREYLMTAFAKPSTDPQQRYNEALIAARNVVERQYGVWKKRFPCLTTALRCDLENAQTIIVATAVLHNIALFEQDYYENEDSSEDEDEDESEDDDSNSTVYPPQIGGITKRNRIVASYFS
ncbi:putative nuclease HARBI1 [Uloborus diversus]|uniref:putative nuclease HARBI1 n=1 Tax=Uloborus diversus TaxID=327109 RepID=UPI002408F52D|nr:putative nuclease HARBI1 [Uloborus diversus]